MQNRRHSLKILIASLLGGGIASELLADGADRMDRFGG
jgi:hypothetical protein